MRTGGILKRNSAAALVALAVCSAWLLAGCEGLRFVQAAEEAKDFHPRSVGCCRPMSAYTRMRAAG